MKDISVFLGANTDSGFRSLYEEAIDRLALKRLYVIKGSAGCGKSGLMKRVADRAVGAGEDIVRVLCSGDPDSLDGLILPGRGTAFFDGTAPHVLEPTMTGQTGFYIDLSRFYTSPAEGLESRYAAYREHYRKAYCYLSAAGKVEEAERCSTETRDAIRRRAYALAERTLGRARGRGRILRCYTDAFTCQGHLSLEKSRRTLAPALISLCGSAERRDLFMQAFLQAAIERRMDVILCPDACEHLRIAHLLLPELGLGITSGQGDRRIHLEKLGPLSSSAEKARARTLEELRTALLSEAQAELALAKADHDRLEAAVKPHIDFAGVTELTEEIIQRVFSEP